MKKLDFGECLWAPVHVRVYVCAQASSWPVTTQTFILHAYAGAQRVLGSYAPKRPHNWIHTESGHISDKQMCIFMCAPFFPCVNTYKSLIKNYLCVCLYLVCVFISLCVLLCVLLLYMVYTHIHTYKHGMYVLLSLCVLLSNLLFYMLCTHTGIVCVFFLVLLS